MSVGGAHANLKSGALEFSLFSLTQVLCIIGCNLLFLIVRPCLSVTLETWLIAGYALVLIIPVWGCIGLADVNFGWKVFLIILVDGFGHIHLASFGSC